MLWEARHKMVEKLKGKSPSMAEGKGKYKIRAHDGLELMKIILDDNPALKQRVLYYLERTLGKDRKDRNDKQ